MNFTIILLVYKICIRLFGHAMSCYFASVPLRSAFHGLFVLCEFRGMRNTFSTLSVFLEWRDFGRSSQRNFRGELASYGDLESQHARSQFTTSRITSQPTRSHHNHTTSHHITSHHITSQHATPNHILRHLTSQPTTSHHNKRIMSLPPTHH